MPSPVQRFTKAAQLRSFAMLGTEPVTIGGGDAIQCIVNAGTDSREFDPGGYEFETSITATIHVNDFVAVYPDSIDTYIGQLTVIRGRNYRLDDTSMGAGFVTLRMVNIKRGA